VLGGGASIPIRKQGCCEQEQTNGSGDHVVSKRPRKSLPDDPGHTQPEGCPNEILNQGFSSERPPQGVTDALHNCKSDIRQRPVVGGIDGTSRPLASTFGVGVTVPSGDRQAPTRRRRAEISSFWFQSRLSRSKMTSRIARRGSCMAVWIVKGGSQGEFEERFLSQGVVGKGGKLPDLSAVRSVDEIREIFEELSPDAKKSQVANHVGQFWSLLRRMEKGELVVAH
jgi:hypothetical protein